MSLLAPNEGDLLALEYVLNKATPDNVVLHLYTNNHTPAKGDTTSSYTESVASGYSAITLTGSSWSVSTTSNVTTGSYAAQTFNFSATDTIYGYYITNNAGSHVVWAELFSSGPFSVVNGSSVTVTPQITLA
jgi:hypothetical protein